MSQRGPDRGLSPERASDSWPALHGRPVLRRTVAIGLVIFVSVLAALAVRGVNALTIGRGAIETDRDRAELLAGLHPSQHPGAGRYYVPVGAVYTHTPDGLPVAYLHYRLVGGREVGVGDFLRTYDLAAPGGLAPLPADLAEALGGDEPAQAHEVGAPAPSGSLFAAPTASPTASPLVPPLVPPFASPTASPTPTVTAVPEETAATTPNPTTEPETVLPEPAEHIAPASEAEPDPESVPTPEETPSPTPAPADTPTADPAPTATPSPAPPPAPVPARRVYVAPDPAGLPGAADIYVRATG
ncbi:hypothetical protein [Kitasatospora sp. NPDC057500]|uniref:hypothetical protein n=1 Tax=Kitasatospora sp. NPDC057500 TaxID=3346151 RepID=UPI0036B997B9